MRPMNKRLGLAAKATVITVAAVAAASAAPAHASAATITVPEHRWVDGCEAILYANSNVPVQVSAGVYFSTKWGNVTESCTGWLERRYGDGSWSVVSGYHHVMFPGESAYTGWYDDSGNGLAKACVTAYLLDAPSVTECTEAW